MIKFFLMLFISCMMVIGCNKQKVARNTPRCIKKEIESFAKTECNDGVKVDEYMFQTKYVYLFDPGNCGADMSSQVLDSDCRTLGQLGGITGNTKINGEEFSNAKFIRNIWKKS